MKQANRIVHACDAAMNVCGYSDALITATDDPDAGAMFMPDLRLRLLADEG
jgi:hypothetical protein